MGKSNKTKKEEAINKILTIINYFSCSSSGSYVTKKKYFKNAQELIEKYHLSNLFIIDEDAFYWSDRLKIRTVEEVSIIQKVKRDNYCYKRDDLKKTSYYAYIMICQDNEYDFPTIKIGYTQNIYNRCNQLNRTSSIANSYSIYYFWEFNNCEDGYEMEIWLHRYYKKLGFELVGQDHFLNCKPCQVDIFFLNKKAEELQDNSKKWLDMI